MGSFSQMVDINSGVRQSSVLGPLLITFIDDLLDKIDNPSCYSFADDRKLLSLDKARISIG